MSNTDLIVEGLVKTFPTPQGSLTVLEGVSLTASPGDTVAIVGPSGSGKSTLLNIIGALDLPTAGIVMLGDIEVTSLGGAAMSEYRAQRVGFVFQDHHLLPQLTALENVLLPTLAARKQEGADTRARGLLERVGITERAAAFPAQLSGGERQRVAVARALINSPCLLLCDEPTGNLDRESGAATVSLLLELAREQQTIVLMVTHNAEHAARFAKSLLLTGGQLTAAAGARP
ncbi:MAG TPA: ABC transporter ATP-binding protein [Armatimonadota bacterium]